jgi:DNA-binding transcriptional LysR family regulator
MMMELRRLRLLVELHERGTIAAVAEALRFTPSAVSQQLAVLEAEAGVRLIERAGRGVRLTDPALVLVEHAAGLLEGAERAEAELAAAAGDVTGRARVAAFQSVAQHLAIPAMQSLASSAPGLRCELVEAEPEQSLPALALGDIDLVLADEWDGRPHARPAGVDRVDLRREPMRVVLPVGHPASRAPGPVALVGLAGAHWTTGHPGSPWEAVTIRACRELGGFDPDIRHHTNDAVISLMLVAGGLAVTLLPDLVMWGGSPGVVTREIAEGEVSRTIYAATRGADAARPSTRALLVSVHEAGSALW